MQSSSRSRSTQQLRYNDSRFSNPMQQPTYARNAQWIETFFPKLLDTNAYPRAICRGYHFRNHAVKTPISAGRTELIAPTKLAASVCMMKYVQMGVIR